MSNPNTITRQIVAHAVTGNIYAVELYSSGAVCLSAPLKQTELECNEFNCDDLHSTYWYKAQTWELIRTIPR